MNFSTLREANVARQAEWDPGSHASNIEWRVTELGGELGELCNILKKLHRERCGMPGSRATQQQLTEELADVVICLDLLAMEKGIDQLDPIHFTQDEVRPLTEIGCRLLAQMGRVAENFRDIISMRSLLGHCRSIARREGIDLEMAVMAKFNQTSEKVGLNTRLVPA